MPSFGLYWISGSGVEVLKMSSMYFHYFAIIFLWKECGPSFEQTWIPIIHGCFMSSLVNIHPRVLEKIKLIDYLLLFVTLVNSAFIYGDVTIADERLPNLGLHSALTAFDQEGVFFWYYTCYNTGSLLLHKSPSPRDVFC